MKKIKLFQGEIIVLGMLFMFTLVSCKKDSNEPVESQVSNFVVKNIDPDVTSVPMDEKDPEEQKEQKEDLSILSSEKQDKINDYASTNIVGDVSQQATENIKDLINGFLDKVGSIRKLEKNQKVVESIVDSLSEKAAGFRVENSNINAATLAACFYQEDISPEIYLRMENKSYSEACTIGIDNLQYVRVLHFGYDGGIYIGELVVNKLIAKDIIAIFKELFDEGYPIEKMVLVDEYDADDNLSTQDNNTSCFNYRVIDGTTTLSKHAYGLAIDINPKYNPHIGITNGIEVATPAGSEDYVDRSLDNPYYIQKDDVCYKAFTKRGFTWGGEWEDSKDYHHFQKVFE